VAAAKRDVSARIYAMGWTKEAFKRAALAGLALMPPHEYYRAHPHPADGPPAFIIPAAPPRIQTAAPLPPTTATTASTPSPPEVLSAFYSLAAADSDTKQMINDQRIYCVYILLASSLSRAESILC
jgi:hypothetical protein